MKVCMLSSVHSANDIRIVEKEARSLASNGHVVTVIACPPGPSNSEGIEFKFVDTPVGSRLKRPWVSGRAAASLARSTKPDVIQFHDPELIPFALLLKRRGSKVIYDVHEDVPADIYSKKWIPSWLHPSIAWGVELVERATARRFDAIVAATPAIAKRFRRYGAKVVTVRNTVRLEEFIEPTRDTARKAQAVYIGLASFNRGLVEMVEACRAAELPLILAGAIGIAEEQWLKTSSGNVVHRGKLDRPAIAALLNESLIGLCLFQAEPNHLHAMPTKIFEYMAAGLPVITSDLPKCKEIVEAADCGFAVSLKDKRALVDKLSMLSKNPHKAIELGLAGRASVIRNYNWQHDAVELNNLYDQFCSPPGAG